MLTSKEIGLQYVTPSIGCVVTTIMFFSPIRDVLRVRRLEDIGELNPLPMPLTMNNCIGYLVYGCVKRDPFIVASNLPGLLAAAFMTLAVFPYAPHKKQEWMTYIVVAITFLYSMEGIIFCFPLHKNRHAAIKSAGYVTVVDLLVFYGAPLTSLLRVLKRRDSSSILLGPAIMNTVNGVLWTCYGAAISDKFIMLPNLAGVLFGVVQIVLLFVFPRKSYGHVSSPLSPKDGGGSTSSTGSPKKGPPSSRLPPSPRLPRPPGLVDVVDEGGEDEKDDKAGCPNGGGDDGLHQGGDGGGWSGEGGRGDDEGGDDKERGGEKGANKEGGNKEGGNKEKNDKERELDLKRKKENERGKKGRRTKEGLFRSKAQANESKRFGSRASPSSDFRPVLDVEGVELRNMSDAELQEPGPIGAYDTSELYDSDPDFRPSRRWKGAYGKDVHGLDPYGGGQDSYGVSTEEYGNDDISTDSRPSVVLASVAARRSGASTEPTLEAAEEAQAEREEGRSVENRWEDHTKESLRSPRKLPLSRKPKNGPEEGHGSERREGDRGESSFTWLAWSGKRRGGERDKGRGKRG